MLTFTERRKKSKRPEMPLRVYLFAEEDDDSETSEVLFFRKCWEDLRLAVLRKSLERFEDFGNRKRAKRIWAVAFIAKGEKETAFGG